MNNFVKNLGHPQKRVTFFCFKDYGIVFNYARPREH